MGRKKLDTIINDHPLYAIWCMIKQRCYNSNHPAYKYYGRRGALFCHNFKRKKVQDDNYFISLVEYIHRNPVHHGFCDSIGDWSWSSYPDYLTKQPSFLEKVEVLKMFGGKNEFIKQHQKNVQTYFELIEDDYW